MRTIAFRTISLLIFSILSVDIVFADRPGTLDTTFGSGGIASFTPPNGGFFEALAVQPDGKIVLGGRWNAEFGLVRFNADGTLDTTFGANGVVKTQIFAQSLGSDLHDVAIQPDGKIIAVGYAGRWRAIPTKPGVEYYYDFATVRYNADGSLDTSFDVDGIATTSLDPYRAGGGERASLQSDGKIVFAGHFQGGDPFFTLFRYNAIGSPDPTFDGDGMATVPLGGSSLIAAMDIKVQPDGKIVVIGSYGSTQQVNSVFLVARLNQNGSLDNSFDGDGIVTTTIAGHDLPFGLALQLDGKIVVGGTAAPNRQSDSASFALARYNANGSLDTTFDGDGKVSTNFGGAYAVANDVALQSDGRIIAGGWLRGVPSGSNFAVARFLPNGSVDTSFDNDGLTITDIGNSDTASRLALQPGGKILAAGMSDGSFVVARYNAGGGVFCDFDGDLKTDISIFRPSNGQWWLNRSTAGDYSIAFGNSADKITPGDFTGDGKTDIAFWRPATGEWFVIRSEDNTYFSHPFGASGDIPAPGDFDGDGKADEGIFRPSTATWYVLRSGGGITIQQFGANGDTPTVADYDGDGKSDIGIWRSAAGEWWIQGSSNNSVVAFPFGASSDKPVAADYTGDGKADAAFYRASTGSWFVLRSEDYSYYAFPFGTSTDIPAPGDYDGDGKGDAAVFRPSSGTWYVQRSTSGILIQNFGTAGDKPVPNAFVP